MKYKVMLAALPFMILGACAQEAEEAAEPAPIAEVEAEEILATDGGPLAGNFETTSADGGTAQWTFTDDGNFTATLADGENITGISEQNDEGICLDYDGDEEGMICYAQSAVAEDGSWTTTSVDGAVSVVRRVAEAE